MVMMSVMMTAILLLLFHLHYLFNLHSSSARQGFLPNSSYEKTEAEKGYGICQCAQVVGDRSWTQTLQGKWCKAERAKSQPERLGLLTVQADQNFLADQVEKFARDFFGFSTESPAFGDLLNPLQTKMETWMECTQRRVWDGYTQWALETHLPWGLP